MTDLEKWAIFLRYSDVPKYRDIVNEIIESKEALKMGASLLMSPASVKKRTDTSNRSNGLALFYVLRAPSGTSGLLEKCQ
jgi:hypothetical protein